MLLSPNEQWLPAFTQIQTVHLEETQNDSNSTVQIENFTINTPPENVSEPDESLPATAIITEINEKQMTPSTSNSSEIHNTASTSTSQDENDASTSSNSNPVDQTITSKKLSSYERKLLFSNYSFDFKKIPKFISDELDAGHKLNASLQHDLVHHVVNDLRQISVSITMETFRSVAKEMSQRYPNGFSIMDKNDQILDMDSITLASALLNHHQYLNRGLKRKLNTDDVTPKHFRKINNLRNGVDNFYADLPNDTSELENMRMWLREHADIKILPTEESAIEQDYFEKTFALQRKYLNNFTNPPTIKEIKSEWPHLLKNKYLLIHFNKLFEKINTSQFPSEFNRLADAIIRKAKFNDAENQIMSRNLKALTAVAQKFNENIEVVLKKYPVSYLKFIYFSLFI